jgi:hypothetical protein
MEFQGQRQHPVDQALIPTWIAVVEHDLRQRVNSIMRPKLVDRRLLTLKNPSQHAKVSGLRWLNVLTMRSSVQSHMAFDWLGGQLLAPGSG